MRDVNMGWGRYFEKYLNFLAVIMAQKLMSTWSAIKTQSRSTLLSVFSQRTFVAWVLPFLSSASIHELVTVNNHPCNITVQALTLLPPACLRPFGVVVANRQHWHEQTHCLGGRMHHLLWLPSMLGIETIAGGHSHDCHPHPNLDNEPQQESTLRFNESYAWNPVKAFSNELNVAYQIFKDSIQPNLPISISSFDCNACKALFLFTVSFEFSACICFRSLLFEIMVNAVQHAAMLKSLQVKLASLYFPHR